MSLEQSNIVLEAPALSSLDAPISPPRIRRQVAETKDAKGPKSADGDPVADTSSQETKPTLAAIEAGQAKIIDHLSYFSTRLSQVIRPLPSPSCPRLSISAFVELYRRHQHSQGHHFVVHQHDHPIAGVHYDLRLQFSESSSVSFAIMYGLPGNPNSKRLNRNAIETRVHCFWVRALIFKTLLWYINH